MAVIVAVVVVVMIVVAIVVATAVAVVVVVVVVGVVVVVVVVVVAVGFDYNEIALVENCGRRPLRRRPFNLLPTFLPFVRATFCRPSLQAASK